MLRNRESCETDIKAANIAKADRTDRSNESFDIEWKRKSRKSGANKWVEIFFPIYSLIKDEATSTFVETNTQFDSHFYLFEFFKHTIHKTYSLLNDTNILW